MSKLALKLIAENKRTQDPFLDLGNCGLHNYLPEELLDCFWLKRLNLGIYYHDKVKANMNMALSSYRKNETNNNRGKNTFTGNEFSILEKLPNLESLDLSDNQISDIRFLEKLPDLESLDLSNNQISDIRFLEKQIYLELLDLRNNQIIEYDFLKNLKNIKYLNLSNNKIKKISFLECNNELINLNGNPIKSITLEQYYNLFSLKNINIITVIVFLKYVAVRQQQYVDAAELRDIEKNLLDKNKKFQIFII